MRRRYNYITANLEIFVQQCIDFEVTSELLACYEVKRSLMKCTRGGLLAARHVRFDQNIGNYVPSVEDSIIVESDYTPFVEEKVSKVR